MEFEIVAVEGAGCVIASASKRVDHVVRRENGDVGVGNEERHNCEHCGRALGRKPYESASACHKRRFCNSQCYAATRRIELPSKSCKYCGADFSRRRDEGARSFRRRGFCSKRCSGLFSAAPYTKVAEPDKSCAYCGKPVIRGRNEQNSHFVKRMHCNKTCARRGRAAHEEAQGMDGTER